MVTQADDDVLVTETVETLMEAVDSETLDESSGVEVAAVTEETNGCSRNSTVLTVIEDVGEKQVREEN